MRAEFPIQTKKKKLLSLPAFDSLHFTQMLKAQQGVRMSMLVTLPVLAASWDLHGHPTPPRRDGIRRAARAADNPSSPSLGRAQGPAPCQSLATRKLLLGMSCLCHGSASATMAGLGESTMILPNYSLRLKARDVNIGIPLVCGGHPAGTSSLV